MCIRDSYYSDNLTQAEMVFEQLKPLCRKMTQLVERQADDNEMAYKLMALFCESKDFLAPDRCLNKISDGFVKVSAPFKHKKNHPYHDAFVTELNHFPTVADAKNIQEWRGFILQFGFPGLTIFADCKLFDQVPKTLQEGQTAQLAKSYPRAQENLGFAAICKSLLIKNDGFESGLDFIKTGWPKKQSDNLPLVDIKVSDETYEYRWVKLPPDDKRALYLGNMIPGCCQFINGDARQCVIDGISLSDNGFYVLLKNKISKTMSSKLDGDVVAHSYVWMSKNGNLCLDSIEWNKGRVSQAILKTLMDRFASEILARNPQIKFVNVGTGGQTPRHFCGDALVSETQRQGTAYGDSASQYCIQSKLTPEATQLLGEMPNFKSLHGDLQNKIRYLSAYLEPTDVSLETIQNMSSLLTSSLIYPFPPIPQQLIASDFQRLTLEGYQQLPPNEQEKISTFRKLLNCESIDGFMQWLSTISDQELLNIIQTSTQDGAMVFHLAVSRPDDLKYILSRLLEQARLDLIRIKDKDGNTLLHLAASNPKSLQTILSHLPVEAHLDNVNTTNRDGNTVLHLAANSPESLQTILSCLPEQARLDAINEENEHQLTILDLATRFPESLKVILSILPAQACIDAIKLIHPVWGMTLLHLSASEPESLKAILKILPQKEHLDALKVTDAEKRTVLHCIKGNLDSLKIILSIYPQEERLASILAEDDDGTTILDNLINTPNYLKTILELLSEEEGLAVVEEILKKARGLCVFHSSAFTFPDVESLKLALEILPERKRLDAVGENVLQLHSATDNPEHLEAILKLFTVDTLIKALRVKNEKRETVLHTACSNPESLQLILKKLNSEQCLIDLMDESNGKFMKVLDLAANEPKSLKAILDILPEHKRIDLLKRCDLFTTNLESIKIILELLPDKDRMSFINITDRDEFRVLDARRDKPEFIEAILMPLSQEERLIALKGNTWDTDMILHEATNKIECFNMIWSLLSKENRELALCEKNKAGKTLKEIVNADKRLLNIIQSYQEREVNVPLTQFSLFPNLSSIEQEPPSISTVKPDNK